MTSIDQYPSSPIRLNLYTSHFLSTWNSRLFEFGAVLFISTIFPGTLFPASIYALCRSASVVVFSATIGSMIDRSERMLLIRMSIVGQRVATAMSCILLFLMLHATYGSLSTWPARIALALLCIFACIEKLSSVINTISVERDWVVVISQGNQDDLQELNSQMRRIDLFCKLVSPLSIALIDGFSTNIAIISTLGMTLTSVSIEYFAIAKVYNKVQDLKPQQPNPQVLDPTNQSSYHSCIGNHFYQTYQDAITYAKHPAFLPSFSLSLLYLTVLSFGAQMTTYLLTLHYTTPTIGVLRTISTIAELSSTYLAPKLMQHIGATRSGIWFLNWQIICVSLAVTSLYIDIPTPYAIPTFLTAVIASRIGLWGFDLSAQLLVQESVESNLRGQFSAVETSVQSVFELLSFASTAVFDGPEQFRYPAIVSACAVGIAGVLYALYVRKRRGHLFHASKCLDRQKRQMWKSVPQDEGLELE